MDVMRSDWRCTLEPSTIRHQPSVRLGLNYARGLREPAAQALVRERSLAPFTSVQDLARRVPELRKDELTTLAEIGALNEISEKRHRRDALWQVERAVRWSARSFIG
jgi:error-prone DNA polymerase